jgi:hypothetical protein
MAQGWALKIETFLGPEMATSEASAIWVQKSRAETFAIQLEIFILSQNGCFLREIFLLFANIWKTTIVRRFSPKGNFFAELNENLQIVGKIDEIEKAIFVSTQKSFGTGKNRSIFDSGYIYTRTPLLKGRDSDLHPYLFLCTSLKLLKNTVVLFN